MKNEQPAPVAVANNAGARQILKTRAAALARPLPSHEQAVGELTVIEFALARERYAIPATAVHEVYPLKDLTPLPCTPAFVLGMINWRGQILPVIDIKKFFDMPEQGLTDLHKVIIVRSEEMELGILADEIVGVRAIPLDAIQSSLPTLAGIREEYLIGVTAERLVILDVARILSDRRIIVDEEIDA
jgi:purine-binding chemotaxis protein CheW